MLPRLAAATMMILTASSAVLACGGAPVCTVADPTGTPLNIRMSPGGTVVGSAKNGTPLEFIEHQEVNGKRWALVSRYYVDELNSDLDGGAWVFGAYLTCDRTTLALPDSPAAVDVASSEYVDCTVTDPTGSPLNARSEPAGEIYATLRNGTIVEAMAQKQHDGDQWIYVQKWSRDNAVGWVFDDYMACEEEGGH